MYSTNKIRKSRRMSMDKENCAEHCESGYCSFVQTPQQGSNFKRRSETLQNLFSDIKRQKLLQDSTQTNVFESDIILQEYFLSNSCRDLPNNNFLRTLDRIPPLQSYRLCTNLPQKSVSTLDVDPRCLPLEPPPEFYHHIVSALPSPAKLKNEPECGNDVVSLLWKSNCHNIIKCILKQLSTNDLITAKHVCQDWRTMIDCLLGMTLRIDQHQLMRSVKSVSNIENDFVENLPKINERDVLRGHLHALESITNKTSDYYSTHNSPETIAEFGHNPLTMLELYPLDELLSRRLQLVRHDDREYGNQKCPQCKRIVPVDLTYHKGKCPYESCRMEFCSMCLKSYHPLVSCKPHLTGQKISKFTKSPLAFFDRF